MDRENSNKPLDDSSTFKRQILEKYCLAWNKMDDTIIAPYLLPTMQYYGFHSYDRADSKEEYLNYLQYNFGNMSDIPVPVVNARIVNGYCEDYVAISRQHSVMILKFLFKDGFIEKIRLLQPDYKYPFEDFKDDFRDLLDIARKSLDKYFKGLSAENPHVWKWIELTFKQRELFDLCLLYEDHLLCINIGLVRLDPEVDSEEYLYNITKSESLRVYCETHKTAIPCLFLLDQRGKPAVEGCHLIDARIMDSLSLDWSVCCKN